MIEIATPIMTTDTTPSGICSADAINFGSAYHAFNRDVGGVNPLWSLRIGTSATIKNGPHWVAYAFGNVVEVVQYRFKNIGYTNQAKDWQLQGWDGDAWTVLHEVAGYSNQYVDNWTPTYTLETPGEYLDYRLYITDWHTGFAGQPIDTVLLRELELYAATPAVEVPAVSFAFDPSPPHTAIGDYALVPGAAFGWEPQTPSIIIGPVSIEVSAVPAWWSPQSVATAIEPRPEPQSSIVYKATLTGAADSLADLVLPISSLQTRLRTGTPSFVSITIPGGETYAAGIAARSNGAVVIERGVRFGDGSVQFVEIARVNLDDIRDDGGGRNRSITIIGHATVTESVPKTRTLQNASMRSSSWSGRRFRASLDMNLRPGDTAIINGEAIVVGLITHSVSPLGELMEISEAAI